MPSASRILSSLFCVACTALLVSCATSSGNSGRTGAQPLAEKEVASDRSTVDEILIPAREESGCNLQVYRLSRSFFGSTKYFVTLRNQSSRCSSVVADLNNAGKSAGISFEETPEARPSTSGSNHTWDSQEPEDLSLINGVGPEEDL